MPGRKKSAKRADDGSVDMQVLRMVREVTHEVHRTSPGKLGSHDCVPKELRAVIDRLWDTEEKNATQANDLRVTLLRGIWQYIIPQARVPLVTELFLTDVRSDDSEVYDTIKYTSEQLYVFLIECWGAENSNDTHVNSRRVALLRGMWEASAPQERMSLVNGLFLTDPRMQP